MTLAANGSLALNAPPDFTGDTSGISFRLVGDEFQTVAFGNDLCTVPQAGIYGWTRSGGRLRFTTIEDPCEVRVALFTDRDWIER